MEFGAETWGEDSAGPGDILLSAAAAARLGDDVAAALDPMDVALSGISLRAFRWRD